MIRLLPSCFACLAMALAEVSCGAGEVFPVVHREPVVVRVLDGKDGTAQAAARVVLVAGYDLRDLELGMWREEAVTDAAGKVYLSDALRNLPLLRVEVLKRHGCETGAGDSAVSVDRVRLDGLTAPNRCGTAMAVNAPGVFTVFVKSRKSAAPGAKLATRTSR
jgi:hypothetical protein